jgi:hypothetical protein
MATLLDRIFGVLLLIGAGLHVVGSILHYPSLSPELVWALSASLAGGLIAVLNLIRAGRPRDLTLAWVACIGSLLWVAIAIAFGASIGSVLDPRVLWHAIATIVLAAFSLRTALGRA